MSFLGLGQIFTANMTGNVVFLALAVGERSLPTALHSVVALIVFSLGAIGAGLLLVKPRPAGTWPQRVTWLLWGELACVASFALLWASADGSPGVGLLYLLIGLSSFGMGLQNAAARHLAVPGLTTTVVTGALTGFMVDLPALGIPVPISGGPAGRSSPSSPARRSVRASWSTPESSHRSLRSSPWRRSPPSRTGRSPPPREPTCD